MSAKNLKNLFALDLGTTKFCVAAVRENPGKGGYYADQVSVAADGMRRGMLANFDQARKALNHLLEVAEREFSADIQKVAVGVAGSHLAGSAIRESITLTSGKVSVRDVQALVAKAEAAYSSDTRELLHIVPVGFQVDSREPVENAIGFSGRVLTAEFFLVDADKYYLRDIVEFCNQCGLQVSRLYSEPFASASVTVPDSYKQMGVALADIGGGTTDGIVFQGGRPVDVFTLNVAGKLMTSDLAIGLNVDASEAEKVKIRFGIRPREGDQIAVTDITGNAKIITPAQTMPILVPRIQELAFLMAKSLHRYKGTLGAGIMLTGGGAEVRGICSFLEGRMKIPVSRVRPISPFDASALTQASRPDMETVLQSKLATVMGLLNLEIGRVEQTHKNRKMRWTHKYIGQLFNWISEMS